MILTMGAYEANKLTLDTPIKFIGINHNAFSYKLGYNEDVVKFDNSSCYTAGLYYTTIRYFFDHYGRYGNEIAFIELLSDSEFIKCGDKSKTNKFNITKIVSEKEFWKMVDDELFEGMLEHTRSMNPDRFASLKIPTPLLTENNLKLLITNNCFMFKMIPDDLKTRALCELAVKKYPINIDYIPEHMRTYWMYANVTRNHPEYKSRILHRLDYKFIVPILSDYQNGNYKNLALYAIPPICFSYLFFRRFKPIIYARCF